MMMSSYWGVGNEKWGVNSVKLLLRVSGWIRLKVTVSCTSFQRHPLTPSPHPQKKPQAFPLQTSRRHTAEFSFTQVMSVFTPSFELRLMLSLASCLGYCCVRHPLFFQLKEKNNNNLKIHFQGILKTQLSHFTQKSRPILLFFKKKTKNLFSDIQIKYVHSKESLENTVKAQWSEQTDCKSCCSDNITLCVFWCVFLAFHILWPILNLILNV